MYQLRTYTLKDREGLDFFRDVVYPRHFASFAKFGMAIHAIWTVPDDLDVTLTSSSPSANRSIPPPYWPSWSRATTSKQTLSTGTTPTSSTTPTPS